MSKVIIPESYQSVLSVYETQVAIGRLKRIFEDKLSSSLNLCRVSAPLFVEPGKGLNDDLSGVERPVEFEIKSAGKSAQIVHSLAKWKRVALRSYGFPLGQGLYTDMNAIRRDDEMDNLHSIYVDQWDWEKVIDKSCRNRDYLVSVVIAIVNAICGTAEAVKKAFPSLGVNLSRNVRFFTTQELEDAYPGLTPKERENACLREYKTVFISQIGGTLKSGGRHDWRAPDYDDWTLNGDIMFWDETLGCAIEISSMGIRVDEAALESQLEESGRGERRNLFYHKTLLEGKLPLTIGGGIGQSRLCMLIFGKAHIGEVQVSVWDDETIEKCRAAGIELL